MSHYALHFSRALFCLKMLDKNSVTRFNVWLSFVEYLKKNINVYIMIPMGDVLYKMKDKIFCNQNLLNSN